MDGRKHHDIKKAGPMLSRPARVGLRKPFQ